MSKKLLEVFKENPFKITGINRVSRNLKKNTEIVANKETGEMYELVKVASQTTLADSRTFIKVYSESADTIKDFGIPALKLYCYILKNLKPNRDYVNIPSTDALNYCGYDSTSRASYYKGIIELCEKQIIAPSTKSSSEYWINCDLIFNGSRLKYYDEDINFEQE